MKSESKKSSARAVQTTPTTLIIGDSEAADLIRAFDWHAVGLTSIETWNPTLLATVNLILQSPVPIVTLWGGDGILIYNDAYSEFAGARHPKLLGSNVVDGWPEVADFNRNVMDVVYKNGKNLSYKDQELLLFRNNRPEQVWLDLHYSPIIDRGGGRIGVFAIVTETTESVTAHHGQKEAEAALRIEQQRLESLFMQAPAMIAVLSGPKHVFELANPMYSQTVAPNRELVGKPLIEAIPELAGQGVVEILDTVLETGVPYKGEMTVRLDRNETGVLEDAHFNLMYQPLNSSATGTADGIFVHAVDITEQIESRRRMERLNAELEAIFESLPDGVYTLDYGSMSHVNQRGAEMLGYASPDDVPKQLEELFLEIRERFSLSPQTASPAAQSSIVDRAFNGEVSSTLPMRFVDPRSGHERYIRSAAAPIRDKDGTVIGAVATASDVTEQYKLQAQMQKELIRRRVLSQKTRLLKEQNEQLTLLNQTKDEFIALTSHQLRTPATGVKQYLGLVTEGFAGEISEQQRDFLERAYASNDRQLQIIDDILRVARIDLDEIKLHTQKQDVVAFIKTLVSEQYETFAARTQTVLTESSEPMIEARIDSRNLGMAIGNIIDNASKYTQDGKTISITIGKKSRAVTIAISDEGVGIEQADLAKLFQKFSRIHNERSIEVGGTGLGLYLAQKLIEKHGGSIQVQSTIGVGTTFTITLPL